MAERHLSVDFAKHAGVIRPLNGANIGPWTRWPDVTQRYKALGIPYVRLHDVPFYVGDAVDMHCIFPNFDADPDDPRNYHFAVTDEYIQTTLDAGSQTVFRLGESIEHYKRKFFVHPPADFEKWADICVHIIRHYNDGGAGGFHHNIRYWEVWNEPWHPACWTGTPQQYYRLYEVTAKAVKAHDPRLMVGGPSAHSGAQTEFAEGFLRHCRQTSAPLDFFTWHAYCDRSPWGLVDDAANTRKRLDELGFRQAEIHLNEWNYHPSPDWTWMDDAEAARPIFARIRGAEGAAFDASALIYFQDSAMDMAQFYTASTGMFGMFDPWYGTPAKPYYAFLAFRRMLDVPRRVQCAGDDHESGLAILAGTAEDGSRAAVLVSRLYGQPGEFEIKLDNLPWSGPVRCQTFLLDQQHDLALVETQDIQGPHATLPLPLSPGSVRLLMLQPQR